MDTGDVIVTVTMTTLNHQRFEFVGPRSTKIEEFRQWALRQTQNQDYACTLIHLGQILKDGQTLAQYSIDDKTFIRATFQKTHVTKPPPSPAELALRTQGLMASFRTCIRLAGASGTAVPRLDGLFRALSESMREVARECPDLAQDRAAYLLVQDAKLHRALLHRPQSISQALLQHPALLDVLVKALERVARSLKPPNTSSSSSSSSSRNAAEASEGSMPMHYDMNYLLLGDQDDDDDEEEDEEVMERRTRQPPSAPLTRDQLSAALSSAISGSGLAPASETAAAEQRITAHDLLNAMNFLPGPSAPAQPVSAPAQSAAASGADPLLSKLNALAELGFTDEAAARRALEAADGDVEMAVDLLLS